jgi:hypothetical protein
MQLACFYLNGDMRETQSAPTGNLPAALARYSAGAGTLTLCGSISLGSAGATCAYFAKP